MTMASLDTRSVPRVLLVLCMTWAAVNSFKIAAFNVQIFGKSKMSKPDVVEVLTQIIQRYDIILIQEIRDSSETSIYELLDKTNELGPAEFDIVLSERLGRTSSKEQYAFLYRKNGGIAVVDQFQYPDSHDGFEREPYAVLFSSMDTAVEDFALVGIHTSPETAVEELDHMADVHDELQSRWNTDNIMILGDLNADCRYVTRSEMSELKLRSDEYLWLIEDGVDTTVKSTDCAYDRFIVTGDEFKAAIVEGSAIPFRYDLEYELDEDMSEDISDHYPIEVELAGKHATSGKSEL